MTFQFKKTTFILIGIVLMGIAFVIDFHTPRGVDDGMMYMPILLLSLFISELSCTISAGIVASILITLGYYYSPTAASGSNTDAITNRIMALMSIWILVTLITIYKRSAKKTLFYKERLGALFEHAQEGIIIVSTGEKITLANPKITEIFGYHENELKGFHFDKLLPSIMNHCEFPCLENPDLSKPEEYTGNEHVFCARRKDGTVFPARVHIWKMEFSGEKYFIFFIFDITDVLKQRAELEDAHDKLIIYAEELENMNCVLEDRVEVRTIELRELVNKLETTNTLLQQEMTEREEAVKALKKSQMMQEAVAVNFPNGILGVLDEGLRFVYARGQDIANYGLVPGDIEGHNFCNLIRAKKNDGIRQLLRRTFTGEKVEFEYQIPDSETVYMFTAVPLPDTQNKIQQILIVSQNITKQKRAEADILNSLQKERELNEMKSRFVTTASHEFRTPLAAIVSSASLISMYKTTEDESKRKKHVNRITSSVTNLTEILNDFLSLGKIGEGKITHHPAEFDIIDLCEDIREEITGITKTGQEVKTCYDLRVPTATLDKQLLRNILINLLSNAVKYSHKEGEVMLNVQQQNGTLKFSVKDNGIGIPEEDRKHLFQTFFRASNVENIQGTGMGLHIVKKYLDIMNGDIEYESELNKGSRFTVKFEN